MTPDMINAIASLWKLVAALSVLFALFMLRKPIEGRLNELYCFKAKDTEVEFTADDKKELRDAAAVPLSPVEENSKKELIADDYPGLHIMKIGAAR